MSESLLLLIIAFYSLLPLSFANEDLVITLPDGQIKGTTYVTQNNITYYAFQGIPYATPPLGSLRFEAPKRPQPWIGVLNTTKDSKACISIEYWTKQDGESEDCLYISVYSPLIKTSKKLPVMFWIYGGAFVTGSNSKLHFGPDFLVEENVVVVTFNYRLAPFGFLSTGDTSIRGNAGLKDQNLALRWTNKNIALFGGDPEKITIFGESAGGASTALHLLSRQSAGLFRAAISGSGSSLDSWAIDLDPKSYAFLLADTVAGDGYKGNDTQKLKSFLQEKTAVELINATITVADRDQRQVWPVLEVEDKDAFITESPYELLKNGRFNQVPIITGICSEESIFFLKDMDTATKMATEYDTESRNLIPTDLRPNSTNVEAVIKAVRNIYLKDENSFANNLAAFANFYSDTSFTRSIIKYADLASSFVPVYLYQFSYYGRVFVPAFIDGAEKVGHGAELAFLFNISGLSGNTDTADVLTQNRMTKLWTNFAKFLDPTPERSDLLNNVTWRPISLNQQTFLNINDTLEQKINLRPKTYPGWNQIFETYGAKPFITY